MVDVKRHLGWATTTAHTDERNLPQELQVLLARDRLSEVLSLLKSDAIEQCHEIHLAPSPARSACEQVSECSQRILAPEELVVNVRHARESHDEVFTERPLQKSVERLGRNPDGAQEDVDSRRW